MASYYSNGKLLITGEYLVLDGAKALALPTKFGQHLEVNSVQEPKLIWESYSNDNQLWLQVEFDLPRLRILSETFDSNIENGADSLALKLQEILLEAKKMSPKFLSDDKGFYVKSKLDFSKDWGLGSSSTLVNNIAQWANIDAFELQFNTFGGSGYDIACAQSSSPVLYQLNDKTPNIKTATFNPSFKEQLYFVHLNKKQNSRDGIAQYENFKEDISTFVDEISTLTNELLNATSLSDFDKLLIAHETIISQVINQEPIQKQLFSDYFGQTKSLGAWGGDFILATGNNDTPNYFKQKGYQIVIPYSDMILCNKK